MSAIPRRSVPPPEAMMTLVPRWPVSRPLRPFNLAAPTLSQRLHCRRLPVALVAASAQLLSLLLRRPPQLRPPLDSAMPRHQPLLHRRRLLQILRHLASRLAAVLRKHRPLLRPPVVHRSNSALPTLLPRLRLRSPLRLARRLLLHRRVDFLTRARKVPAPLRLRLDSMQLPLFRSNSSLLRVGSALRLALALLLPLLRLVASVLEPAEVRIRAANSAAESSEHAGLLVKHRRSSTELK
mmetsp:Transcript_26786/g.62678  ORF Transcript_26786/g.62678 Transcript_26786/m.62678 type:complete len:239 (+) Transcript_26786:851-1567(+)